MTLQKWHPMSELENMRREMDRMFEEFFPTSRRALNELISRRLPAEKGIALPSIDIIDRDDEVEIMAEFPGVPKENIDISFQENVLIVKGEIKTEREVKEEHYYYAERGYKGYSRSINIPFKVNADKIRAAVKDGILSIHMPKEKETQTKKIKVDVA
ncbi:MAG: Hsp20/alpha crystallin family protein [Deltaproteobacteria bacterium]|nr:Hsp20/alpha crystallin family protein [Deltaproteobacteria bacterium]